MKNLFFLVVLFASVTALAQQDGATGPSVAKTIPVIKVDAQPNNNFVSPNTSTRSVENKDNPSGHTPAPSTTGAASATEQRKDKNSTLQNAGTPTSNGRREQPQKPQNQQ